MNNERGCVHRVISTADVRNANLAKLNANSPERTWITYNNYRLLRKDPIGHTTMSAHSRNFQITAFNLTILKLLECYSPPDHFNCGNGKFWIRLQNQMVIINASLGSASNVECSAETDSQKS